MWLLKRSSQVLALLESKNTALSREDISKSIADYYQASRVTLIRDLTKLAQGGYIVVMGTGPSTKYKVKDRSQILRHYDEDQYFNIQQDDRT
jgi:predicted DNA-binding transcriptional regulator YafY